MKFEQTRKVASARRLTGCFSAVAVLFLGMMAWPAVAEESASEKSLASEFPSREAAIVEIQQVLGSALESLGEQVRSEDAPVNRPMACPAAMAGKVSAASSIQQKLKIVREVEPRSLLAVMDQHWKKAGLDTYLDAENSRQPTLRTSWEGYNLALRVAETKREAYLIGITPCLPYDEPPTPRSPLDKKKDS